MRAIDLFSGCGGLSLGLEKAGYEVVAAFDNWDPAIAVYERNFSHPIFKRDLFQTDEICEEIKMLLGQDPLDLIVGGPPCQDFSQAGSRNEGERANLTASFANTISKLLPPYFIMENVDRALKSKAYSSAKQQLKSVGYGLTEIVLDASRCGAPQKRKRLFVVGSLRDSDDFLLETLLSNLSAIPMTIRDYLGESLNVEYYYRHPRNYNRRGIFSIDEPAPTVRGVNRPVPKGYPGHHGDPVELSADLRALTTKERSLLQTFPSSFEFFGTKTAMEQMIGNAVPVNLAKFVADGLNDYLLNQVEDERRVSCG